MMENNLPEIGEIIEVRATPHRPWKRATVINCNVYYVVFKIERQMLNIIKTEKENAEKGKAWRKIHEENM